MKCTGKEWDHCRVEKMGCPGCYYDEIEKEEYIRFKDGIIDKIVDVIETHGNRKLIAFEKSNSYKSNVGLANWLDKHGKKISDVLKEGDVIFYKINNFSTIYMSKVKKYKNGLGVNHYSLEQLDIMKVITEKELKQTGYDVKEVQYGIL